MAASIRLTTMPTTAARRNAYLRLDDAALLKESREERYRSSGPGGQRRNKVETALRLHHGPTGVAVHAEESRYLRVNRTRALRRLRERIALEVRAPFDLEAPKLPEEFVAQRGPKGPDGPPSGGSLAVNPRNPVYPIVSATALDALAAAGGSYAKAARALGLTTSQLLRFLRSDRHVWQASERFRK
jgi:hypothetical protein